MTILPREQLRNRVRSAVEFIRSRWTDIPRLVVVCGSGMSEWMNEGAIVDSIPYSSLPAFPLSSVVGHSNSLIKLQFYNRCILVFSGRSHLYEGKELADVLLPTILAHELGVRDIVLSNAAGGLNPEFAIGDVMIASDLLNFSPHVLKLLPEMDRIPPMIDAWGTRVLTLMSDVAWLKSGVYCSVSGPSYETRAEIAMFSRFADAIGMSTVHEAQCARQLGMRLIACSLISNTLYAPPAAALRHEDVVAASHNASSRIAMVVDACCNTLHEVHAR